MKDVKNPELRRELICYLALTLAFAAGGWFLSPLTALVLFCGGIGFTLLHVWFVHRRYREIAGLSRAVDRLLHDPSLPPIDDNEEGELAILRSEIRKMTLRLKESVDLLQRDKRQLTEAVADISHQLRTPLTSMNLTASLLAQEELTGERRLALTRELQKSLQRIDWLVETLLKLSKLDAGTVRFAAEQVAVAELLRKAAQPFLIPMELREQTLEIRVGDENFTGDLVWSAEALGNIIKNAMEHTPVGGTVYISALQTPIYTQITVRDTGPGFEKADLPYLFERFYRGKNAATDSIGIGLALSRSILAAQNGTVQAENDPAGGARFTLRFYHSVV